MRITMGMVSRQYNKNLNNSLNQLNTASNRSTSYRRYDKASEDPFSSAKAYSLKREFQQNSDYQSNLADTVDQLSTAQSSMMSVYNIVSTASTGDTIQAISGTLSSDDRTVIATKLRALQQSILSPANTKFGDKYIFGGTGETQPPFSVGAKGNLLYRGIDVNTGKIEAGTTATMNGSQITLGIPALNGYKINVDASTAAAPTAVAIDHTATPKTLNVTLKSGSTNEDLLAALKGATGLTDAGGNAISLANTTMTGDLSRTLETAKPTTADITDTIGLSGLQRLSDEKSFVDLGMGLKLNADGSIDEQSVFNSAIPGLSFMGFGTTDDTGSGVSNNLYTLLGQIADQLEKPDFSMNNIKPYLDNLAKQSAGALSKVTESGTKSNFLTTTQKQLETMGDNVNDKLNNNEFIDPIDAYLDYTWQQYAYQSALKVGSQILQPTFLDFMK
jgi:flagellar hook-associated protein 3